MEFKSQVPFDSEHMLNVGYCDLMIRLINPSIESVQFVWRRHTIYLNDYLQLTFARAVIGRK